MDSKKIVVAVDFTPASDQAIEQAILMARPAGVSINLLHVMNNDSSVYDKTEDPGIEDKIVALAKKVEQEGITCSYTLTIGSIFHEIPVAANNPENFMLILGTHGIHGLKQILMGADVLKIVRKVSVPCLIVQEKCACNNYNPIVFPVGGHEGFIKLIDSTALISKLFNSEVHIYSVTRKGEDESEKIRSNIALTEKIFQEKSVSFKRIKDDLNIVSVGYARQTLQYANSIGAGLISIMSVITEENYYFAQADKETLINNKFNIPILCLNGLENNL